MAFKPVAGRNVLRTFIAFVRQHPVISVVAFLTASLSIMSWTDARDRAAYESSPEGKAAAAQKAEADQAAFEVDFAKGLVKARLRDPESAQFLAPRFVKRNGEKGVCGYVNSRNGFGGMSGNDAFAVIDVDVILASEAYPKNRAKMDRLCDDR